VVAEPVPVVSAVVGNGAGRLPTGDGSQAEAVASSRVGEAPPASAAGELDLGRERVSLGTAEPGGTKGDHSKLPEGGAGEGMGRAEGPDTKAQDRQSHPEGEGLVEGGAMMPQDLTGAAAPKTPVNTEFGGVRSPLLVEFSNVEALHNYQTWLRAQGRQGEGGAEVAKSGVESGSGARGGADVAKAGVESGSGARGGAGDSRAGVELGAGAHGDLGKSKSGGELDAGSNDQRQHDLPAPQGQTAGRVEGGRSAYSYLTSPIGNAIFDWSHSLVGYRFFRGPGGAWNRPVFPPGVSKRQIEAYIEAWDSATVDEREAAIERAMMEEADADERSGRVEAEERRQRIEEEMQLREREGCRWEKLARREREDWRSGGGEAPGSRESWRHGGGEAPGSRSEGSGAQQGGAARPPRPDALSHTYVDPRDGIPRSPRRAHDLVAPTANAPAATKAVKLGEYDATMNSWHNHEWCCLVDDLRSVPTMEVDGFNHLVWGETAAAKAIERTSSVAAVEKALQEDARDDWWDNEVCPERTKVLERGLAWLEVNRSKKDPAAWRPSELSEGIPYYLQRRVMHGEPFLGTYFYRKGTDTWGFQPKEPPVSPQRKVKRRIVPPASPQEGVSAKRCVNCGVVDSRHPDLWNCQNPRVDVVRTTNELQLLAAFDAFRRTARKLKKDSKEESSSSEVSLGSEDSFSEEEDEEEEQSLSQSQESSQMPSSQERSEASAASPKRSKKGKKKAWEAGLQTVSEDIRSLAVLLRSTVESQATQQRVITAIVEGRTAVTVRQPLAQQAEPAMLQMLAVELTASQRSAQQTQERPPRSATPPVRPPPPVSERLDWTSSREREQRERGHSSLAPIVIGESAGASAGAEARDSHGRLMPRSHEATLQRASSSVQRVGHAAGGGVQGRPEPGTASLSSAGTRSAADLPGMDGCPEIDPVDLLKARALETLSKEYDEYVDLCHSRDRAPKPFSAVFVKHSTEIAMKFNKLIRGGHALATRLCAGRESYTGDYVLTLPNAEFAALYKEICTGGVKAPSQIVEILDKTKFRRNLGKDEVSEGNEHDALVMRAAAAFRENLDSLPMEVLRLCPDAQLKRSFVKVVLGKGEGNLADYSRCTTWIQCVDHMLDIASTDLSESFLKRARAAGRLNGEDSDEEWTTPKNKKDKRSSKGEDTGRRGDSESRGGSQGDETRADDPDDDIRKFKQEYLSLREKVRHSDADLADCGTYWKKVKKLRWIRDQQSARMDESRRAGGGGAGGGGGGASPQNSAPGNQWRGGRSSYGDQRQSSFQSRGYQQQGEGQGGQGAYQQRASSPGGGYQPRSQSPWRGQDNGPPSRAQVPPAQIVCYNCNELGHISRDCKQPRRAASPRQNGGAQQGGGGGAAATPK